jgi:hypothetical protein
MAYPKGAPKVGGRQKGTPNRATAAKAAAIAASGLTPLDYLLSVMRDDKLPNEERRDAAKAAAPYVHPKLASVEHTGDPNRPLHAMVDLSGLDDNALRQVAKVAM